MTGPELRHLPWSRPQWEGEADVVVVGSGAAGMTAALTAARRGRRVLMITKEDVGGGATPLAQTRARACATRTPWPRSWRRRRARSPGWPGAGPGWSGRRSTWRPGTAATGS